MAQGSFVQVAPNSTGVKVATGPAYTENSNSVQDEKFIPGETYLPTYTAVASQVSWATTASHAIQIMAGAALNVRIRRIRVSEHSVPAAISANEMQLVRVTTAGSGGTAITPRPFDTSDAAAGATAQTLPSSKGTEGAILWSEDLALGTGTVITQTRIFEWFQVDENKPIIIPAGTTNGLVLKIIAGVASATCNITVEFVETSF